MDEWDSFRASSTTPIFRPHPLIIVDNDVILFAELDVLRRDTPAQIGRVGNYDYRLVLLILLGNGLSAERQWYLYDKIREFCPQADRDVTCPLPSVPNPSRAVTPAEVDDNAYPTSATSDPH
jgi:hypothetical protein